MCNTIDFHRLCFYSAFTIQNLENNTLIYLHCLKCIIMIHEEITLFWTLCKLETRVPLSLIHILLRLLQASQILKKEFFKVNIWKFKILLLSKYLASLMYWKLSYAIIIKLPLVFSYAQNDTLSKSFFQFMMLEYGLVILSYYFLSSREIFQNAIFLTVKLGVYHLN